MSDRPKNGEEVRRQVLGDAHVDHAKANQTQLDLPFQDLVTDAAWGTVWANQDLTLRERSMITLALLAAGGHWDEVAMHVRATANTGATPEDIREVFMHVAIYAGVPAANHALKVARETYAEMGVEL